MSVRPTAPLEFHCPRWPGCQCPDGTIADDCPGITLGAERAYEKRCPICGGGDHGIASLTCECQRTDPGEAMALEQAVAVARRITARRPRKISADALISDMNAILIRCERGLAELNAIHTELTMIRNDMAQMHGLPRDTARPSGPDLLDAEGRN